MTPKPPSSDVFLSGSYSKNITALPIRDLLEFIDLVQRSAEEKKVEVSVAEIRSLEGLAGCDVMLRVVKQR